MLICKKCGRKLNEGAIFCDYCGVKINSIEKNKSSSKIDIFLYGVSAIILPLSGFAFYIIFRKDKNDIAKKILVLSIIATVIYSVLILFLVFYFILEPNNSFEFNDDIINLMAKF